MKYKQHLRFFYLQYFTFGNVNDVCVSLIIYVDITKICPLSNVWTHSFRGSIFVSNFVDFVPHGKSLQLVKLFRYVQCTSCNRWDSIWWWPLEHLCLQIVIETLSWTNRVRDLNCHAKFGTGQYLEENVLEGAIEVMLGLKIWFYVILSGKLNFVRLP